MHNHRTTNLIVMGIVGLLLAMATGHAAGEEKFGDPEAYWPQMPQDELHKMGRYAPDNMNYHLYPNPLEMDLESEETARVIHGTLLKAGARSAEFLSNGKALHIDLNDITDECRQVIRVFQVRGNISPRRLDVKKSIELERSGLKSYTYIRNAKSQIDFLLYSPNGSDLPGREYPLLLYLHGTGGCGDDNFKHWKVDVHGGAMKFMSGEFQKYMPCYVLIPQSRMEGAPWISMTTGGEGNSPIVYAVQSIDVLKSGIAPNIDMRRLYITGLSAGGIGCFVATSLFPGKFAAIVPVSGLVGPQMVTDWSVTPTWLAFNNRDTQIYHPEFEGLKKKYGILRGCLNVTIFDGKGHDAWNRVYDGQDFRKWLEKQSLKLVRYPSDWNDPVK